MALMILGITLYLMGIYPFIWHYLRHSIIIKEWWEQFKHKVSRQKKVQNKVIKPEEIKIIHLKIDNKKLIKNKLTSLKYKIIRKKANDK